MREVMPGHFLPRSSSAACTLPPATSTTAWPLVCCRIGVGMWIRIAMNAPFRNIASRSEESYQGRLARLVPIDQRFKLLQRGTDNGRLGQAIGHCLLGLEAVAGDAQDDLFVARQPALLEQLLG